MPFFLLVFFCFLTNVVWAQTPLPPLPQATPTLTSPSQADNQLNANVNETSSLLQIDLNNLQSEFPNYFTSFQLEALRGLNGVTFSNAENLRQILSRQGRFSLEQIDVLVTYAQQKSTNAQGKPLASSSNPTNQLSQIEQFLQPSLPQGLFRQNEQLLPLLQFGYSQLRADRFNFDPVANPSQLNNYRLGPGDEVLFYSAQSSQPLRVLVDTDGMLYLPQIDPISVIDLSIVELNRQLGEKTQFSHVALGQLRSIQVNLVGEVNVPGLHRVPAIASVYNVLGMTGGVNKNGSLRRIQWKRDSQILAEIDLYRYFIAGEVPPSLPMQSGDTIFVPLLEETIAVVGQVRRNAIFEIKDEKSLHEVLHLAGGMLPSANTRRIIAERVDSTQQRRILEQLVSVENQNFQVPIKNFDVIKVFPIAEKYEQYFSLVGPFTQQGAFELKSGLTLRDALQMGGQITQEIRPSTGQIRRLYYAPQRTIPEVQVIAFDYQKVLDRQGMHDFRLQDGDIVRITPKPEFVSGSVIIQGDIISRPGEYPFAKGITIKGLIHLAGGLKHNALDSQVTITRWQKVNGKLDRLMTTLQIDPETFEVTPEQELQVGDLVFVRALAEYRPSVFVRLEGEVLYPGTYEFKPGQHLSDLIERAGGFTEKAFLRGAIFTRDFLKIKENAIDQRIQKDVQRSLLQGRLESNLNNSQLASGDGSELLGVFSQLQSANNQQIPPSSPLSGTLSQSAKINSSVISEQENRKLQSSNLGRLVVNLRPLAEFRGTTDDIELIDGDILTIPPKINSILVKGETYGEASLPLIEGATAYYYLNTLGGPRPLAALEEVYILQVNGLIRQHDLENYALQAGDVIVVPPDLTPRENPVRETASMVDLIFKTLGTIFILVKLF